MHSFQRILPAAAALALLSTAAHALELFTPMSTSDVGQYINCVTANVGTKPIEVSATIRNANDGSDVTFGSTCPASPATLDPGTACSSITQLNSPTAGYCQFTTSSSKVRAALLVRNGNFFVTSSLPATK
jgi:hypothetical protein